MRFLRILLMRYDVIGVNLFHFKPMRFHFKKGLTGAPYTTDLSQGE